MENDDLKKVVAWLENSDQEAAVKNWKEIFQDVFLCLLEACIPFSQYLYIPDEFRKKSSRLTDMQLSDVKYLSGIILEQIRYIDHLNDDVVKTMWITKKEWKNKPGKRHLISECQWTLRPLSITTKSHTLDPKKQKYLYKISLSKKSALKADFFTYMR